MAFVLIVSVFTLAAFTTNKSAGTRKCFLNIDATGVYAFPASGTANLTSPFTSAIWAPSFLTIARYDGTGNGTFVVYSPCFNGGSDTVMAGDVVPEITARIDSLECVSLGSGGGLFQAEGSN